MFELIHGVILSLVFIFLFAPLIDPPLKTTNLFVEKAIKMFIFIIIFLFLPFLRLYGGNLEMLPVPVLELGNICLETSTKDQCERHSFKQEVTTARER